MFVPGRGFHERVIVLTETQVSRSEALLGIDPERCALVPNGFDPKAFQQRTLIDFLYRLGPTRAPRTPGLRRTRSWRPASSARAAAAGGHRYPRAPPRLR